MGVAERDVTLGVDIAPPDDLEDFDRGKPPAFDELLPDGCFVDRAVG